MKLNKIKKTLVYALHSGNLYGTEQMAMATCDGLRDEFDSVIIAPQGLVIDAARQMGFETHTFSDTKDFVRKLRRILAENDELVFIATGIAQSFALIFLNLFYQRNVKHLHIVHGGTDEQLNYRRKRFLNYFDVTLVAVSKFVKERLIAHQIRAEKITIIENFLTPELISNCPQKLSYAKTGLKKVAIVSRVDPSKRIDLLLDALDKYQNLSELEFTIYGTGSELENLSNRARRNNPNVHFEGFHSNITQDLAKADLLLHLCPTEPFGLAILEAMAVGVPVLVPNSGGAGSLITDGLNGFHFRANDIDHLAARLNELSTSKFYLLDTVIIGGKISLNTRFSSVLGIESYRKLIKNKQLPTEMLFKKGVAL